MGREDLINLIIQERLSLYFQTYPEHGAAELEKSDEFLAQLKEKAPELATDFRNYLDWMAEHSGAEQEGIYLFGLHDGIRLMQDIISVA